VGLDVAGLEGNGPGVALQRLLVPVEGLQGVAAIAQRADVVGPHRQGLVVACQCVLMAAERNQDCATIIEASA